MEEDQIYIIRAPRNHPPLSTRPKTGASYRRIFQSRPPPTKTAGTSTTVNAPGVRTVKLSWNLQPTGTKATPRVGSSTTLNTPVPRTSDRRREEVLEILKVFRERCAEILRNGKSEEDRRRVDLKVFTEVKRKLTIPSADYVGAAPGVQVGDRFEVRVELILTGIHGKLQNGIDFATFNGRSLATCIISKIGYKDKMNDPESLVYSGEGGMARDNGGSKTEKKKVVFFDQKMKNGNLALKNSMEAGKDVRVLRGVQNPRKRAGFVVYVYYGLYKVVDCKKKRGDGGNMVFDFYLRRNPGQKTINWNSYR